MRRQRQNKIYKNQTFRVSVFDNSVFALQLLHIKQCVSWTKSTKSRLKAWYCNKNRPNA